MTGQHIKYLREKAGLSQNKMGNLLGVTQRTIAKFESENDTHIASAYANICRTLFESLVLTPALQDCTKKIFETVKSEWTAIWLVCHSIYPIQQNINPVQNERFWEVILHEHSTRFECFLGTHPNCHWRTNDPCSRKECFLRNDRIHKNLSQESLTTYPLRSGELIRLSGNKIEAHPSKRMPGRKNHFFHKGQAESILHIPLLKKGRDFPQPIALLVLENKLNDKCEVMQFPEDGPGEAACFILTEISFKELAKDLDVEKLKPLINQEFPNENLFLNEVKKLIKEDTEKYKPLLLQYAGEAYTKRDIEQADQHFKQLYEDNLKFLIEAFDYIPSP